MIVGYYKNYLYTTDKVSSEKKKKIMRSTSIWFRTPKPVRIRQSGRTRIGGVTSTMSSLVDSMTRDNLDTNMIAHDRNLIIMIPS